MSNSIFKLNYNFWPKLDTRLINCVLKNCLECIRAVETKSQRTLNLGLVFCYKAYRFWPICVENCPLILAFFGKNCGNVHILPLVALYYKKTARNKLRLFDRHTTHKPYDKQSNRDSFKCTKIESDKT